MKIVTWNVNGIRTRIFDSLDKATYEKTMRELNRTYKQTIKTDKSIKTVQVHNRPIRDNSSLKNLLENNIDFICLQETRCDIESSKILQIEGYESIFNESKLDGARQAKRYSGTCIYYKVEYKERISKIEYQIPNYDDKEGRIILIYLDGNTKLIINVYVPNSGTNLENRILFQEAMYNFLKDCIEQSIQIIYCGDFNVAYKESDIHFNYNKSSTYKKVNPETSNIVGFLPVEREFILQLKELKMIDTFENTNDYGNINEINPEDFKGFTWWETRVKKELNENGVEIGIFRKKNIGWRIDYIFTGNIESKNIINTQVLKHIGEENSPQSSDHGCVLCELDFN